MTDRYPLDPRDEIRECSECNGRSPLSSCVPCTGRGYVVGRWVPEDLARNEHGEIDGEWNWLPAADQRVIEVYETTQGGKWLTSLIGGRLGDAILPVPTQPTKDEALLAARCAVWGVRVFYDRKWEWCWEAAPNSDGHVGTVGYHTPTDALCAAIDAMETR